MHLAKMRNRYLVYSSQKKNGRDIYYGDATIRTKYQIRTRDRFGPKTNSAHNFSYL